MSGVTQAEYNAMRARLMTEAALQACVIALAQRNGWLVYHTHDSRRSQPGYPDLHLIHPATGRSLFRELKTQKGRLSPAQREWLDGLTATGADAAVWRPADWFDDTVMRQLHPDPVAGELMQIAAGLGTDLMPWQLDLAVKAVTARPAIVSLPPRAGKTTLTLVCEKYILAHLEATR